MKGERVTAVRDAHQQEQEQEQGLEQQQKQERKRRKTEAVVVEKEGSNDKATAVVEGATTTFKAMGRSEIRGSVLKGLVAALVPWEHSRQTQRTTLLVLGSILENALDEVPHPTSEGMKDRRGAHKNVMESCAADLDKALAALATEGQGEWADEEEEQEEGAAGGDR